MFTPSRRKFLSAASLAGAGALVMTGCSRTSAVHGQHGLTEETAGLSPDQALAKLKEGNVRFVDMDEVAPNVSATRLMAVSEGQQPFVGVLGCVDSRVPPELVFDRGLGDVFDARIAGAIADDAAIGSLEFGVEEFGVPLLVVLGHSRCGAVTAAVKAEGSGKADSPGRIGAIVDPILPSVKAVKAAGVTGGDVVNAAAKDVVRRGVDALQASPVLAGRLSSGKLKVVGAFYDLDSGKVEFLP
ncbi:MAG: carbonic anhydrase [Mycobacterium sp.]